MKKNLILGYIFFVMAIMISPALADSDSNSVITISNGHFSLTLPYDARGTYVIKKKNTEIFVYEKESKKAGYGGFAFGIKAFKNPADHAMMPRGQKLGELTDKKGNIFDMVLVQPTDVQFDYTNGVSEPYMLLYNFGEKTEVKGVHGYTYNKNQGMKGENLYKDVLKKHVTAIKEKWDSIKLEHENMSYMYNVLAVSGINAMEKIGYVYYDVNNDGIDELLIGEIADGKWKGVVYDIYTMVNRKPTHVVSGRSRSKYFVCNNEFICNEYSSGAKESGTLVYVLVENSTELYPQAGFKYDAYENKNKPWFISYDFVQNKWDNVSENVFSERKLIFDKYKKFDFIPLNTLNY